MLYISCLLVGVIVALLWPERKKKNVGADPRVCMDKDGTTNKGAHMDAPLQNKKLKGRGNKDGDK